MKALLLIISIVFSLPTFAVTPADFQVQLEQLNAVFSAGEGLLGPQYPVKKLRVELGEALSESQPPWFQLSKDLTVLKLHIPPSHLQDPGKMVVLLAQLAGALEYPLEIFTRYGSSHQNPPIVDLLRFVRSSAGVSSFFNLAEMTAESAADPIIKMRWEMAYLLAFQNAEHLANKRFLAETLQSVFPSLRIDSRDLVANAKKAADLLEKKYATAPWAQLERFFSVLGSEKILKWVEQGDRKAVAQYLENALPVEMLTAREVAFWQGQIEAIRKPSPNNLGYVFRGGRFNIGSAPGYASLSLRTKEHTRKLKSITLAAALSKVSLLNTLYSHSESTSETFISTTTDSSIGTQFSERSGNFSVLAIDTRRILPVYFTRWGESELLIPWLVFPDEVVGSTQKSSVSQLLRSFADKVARTEEVFMEKNNVKTFLQSSLAPMCQSVLL